MATHIFVLAWKLASRVQLAPQVLFKQNTWRMRNGGSSLLMRKMPSTRGNILPSFELCSTDVHQVHGSPSVATQNDAAKARTK